MSGALGKRLVAGDWLLADGATGTNLFNMGLEAGEAPEFWNDAHPDRVAALYRGAVEAGSDLFLTNSFGANAARLRLHGAQDRAHALSRIAAEIGREVADRRSDPPLVAGSMGPTGDILEPVGTLSHAAAVEIFHQQADGLREGGADVLWLETISAREEFLAAAEGIALAGLDWCATMSFDTAGRTMMGLSGADFAGLVDGLDPGPLAFGANCGVGAADLLRTVIGITQASPCKPLIAKGNAGIPKYVDGHIHYDGTPELMARYAVMARDLGVRIIGGCCGTTPDHLRAMRAALDETPPGPPPAPEDIERQIGPFSSPEDGSRGAPARRVRRGRRR